MKTLRTIYSYGLNKRARKHDSDAPVGKLALLSLELSNDLPDKEKLWLFEKWHYHRLF